MIRSAQLSRWPRFREPRLFRKLTRACRLRTLVLLAATGAAGCAHDPRISLDEFLEMQAATAEPAEAVTEAPGTPLPVDDYLPSYRVGPLDVLVVTLTGLDAPTQSTTVRVRVDQNGEAELPLVGAVRVADREVPQVEEAITAAYVPTVVRQLTANVQIEAYEPTNVIVLGAAQAPGLIPLRRTERNLLFAVAGAGGFSSSASGQVTLRRIRRPGELASFQLTDPNDLSEALAQDPLESGDIVWIEAAQPNTVFVGGLVNAPRPQVYPPGVEMNVLQVLAAAGGLRTDVTPREGTLIRRMPDGEDVHVKIPLDLVAQGLAPNVALEPGDVLWVPETLGTKVEDFINRNIFMRAGVTVTYSVTGVEFMNRHELQGGRTGGRDLEDAFDPFGFFTRSALLQAVQPAP